MVFTTLVSLLQAATLAIPTPPADLTPARTESRAHKCPEVMHWALGTHAATASRLDQLPPGRLELTVLRTMGNCPEPVVLREGIGGNPNAGKAHAAPARR